MIDDLQSFVEATGPFGPVAFVLAYVILTAGARRQTPCRSESNRLVPHSER